MASIETTGRKLLPAVAQSTDPCPGQRNKPIRGLVTARVDARHDRSLPSPIREPALYTHIHSRRGQILINRGLITSAQLDAAITVQLVSHLSLHDIDLSQASPKVSLRR